METSGIFQLMLGSLVSIASFALVVAGVMKVFQIATDLREMKDVLHDIRRQGHNFGSPPAYPSSGLQSGLESMAGAVAVQPEVVPRMQEMSLQQPAPVPATIQISKNLSW